MKKIALLLLLCNLSVAVFATTYYNKSSGTAALQTLANWGTATNGTGTAPGSFTNSGDIFNLSNGTAGTISAAWVITSVTLNVNTGFNLTIPSAYSLSGTGTVAVGAGATLTLQNTTNPTFGTLNATSLVDYNGTSAQTIGIATYGNLSLSGARTGTPAITLPSGTIKVAGDFFVTYTGAVTFTTSGNTFNYSNTSGGSEVGGINYNTLSFSNTSGIDSAEGNITVAGNFTTVAGGTLDMGATSILSVTGTITNNGIIQTEVPTSVSATPIPSGKGWKGTVIYGAAAGSQTIVSETYYTILTLSNTSGTNTAGGNITAKGLVTTTAGGTLDMTAAYRLISSGSFAVTNNGTIQTSVPTSLSAVPLPASKTWNGTGTVLYAAAAGGQTIMRGTYNCNLTIGNTSGTNTASNAIVAKGLLTTTSGGVFSMGTYALSGTPTVVNNGTISTLNTTGSPIPSGLDWTGTTGNMIFAATGGSQKIPAGTYGTLKLSNTSGTTKANGTITVNTALITSSGGTLNMAASQLLGGFVPENNGTIKTNCSVDPAIPSGQTWSGTTGVVTFALAGGGQFVPAGVYDNLNLNNSTGTNTADGDITVNVGMTTTAGGTLDMGAANVLDGTGTFTNNGTIQTSVPTTTSATPIPSGEAWDGTIIYGAAAGAQTVVAGTYNNLTLSNSSGTNTAGGDVVVNTGTMTTTAGGTLDMGSFNILSGTGTFTNNGVILTSVPTSTSATPIPSGEAWGGTIIYGATTGAQTIVSETSYNNLTLNNASDTNISADNLVINGGLATTAGGILDMGAYALSGTIAPISGGGTITTANTSGAPLSSGATWTQAIVYYNATGGQTIVSGTYTGGLTNSNASGTNTVAAAGTVSIPGTLTLASGSTLNDNGVVISLAGNISGTGTHISTGTGAVSMTGSGATIDGATLGNLTLNNPGGFSTTDNVTINGTLTLSAGKLNIGANNLIFGTSAPSVAGTPSSSAMIIANGGGQVQKQYSTNGSFLFPIGDNSSNYSPITLNFTGGTYAGGAYAGVNVTKAKHPQNGNTTNFLSRYWSIATSGITSPVYAVTAAMYVPGDVTGTESNLALGAYTSYPWVKLAGSSVNTSTHTLSATGTLNSTNVDITGINATGPSVSISSPSSSVICNGGSQELDASPSGDAPFSYVWTPSTGLSATTGATIIASPTTTGTVTTVYTYTVTLTDGLGFTTTATHTITVNPTPVISGVTSACLASTTTLSSSIAGTWSSSNSSIASVGSSTGIVNGVALGTAIITITPVTGCTATAPVSINATPATITGANTICSGSTVALSESVSGGLWSSSDTTIASVDASGNVTGVGSGNATITYTSGSSCYVTYSETVGPLLPITGTLNACIGLTTTLSDASTGGTWSSSNLAKATVGSSTGIVTGVSAGTVNITYTLVSGCTRTASVTINAVPLTITGTPNVCFGLTTALAESTTGGAWSSSNSAIASVGTSGIVTGVASGTATISYISGPGCSATQVVTVNSLPATITGTMSVCVASATTLTDATGSGTWSSGSSNATVGSSTGIVSGVAAGNAAITYTLPTGCINKTTVTINAVPAAITGTVNVCAGLNTTLSDATSGGTWSSSNTSLATVGTGTGIVHGVAAGTPTITYALTATGCAATTPVTVNSLPSAITGTKSVCVGSTTTLTDGGGGTWASSNANATIGSSTGIATGVTAGTSTITYTLPTGCHITGVATVNALPASITGTVAVCVGSTTTLHDATGGGTWTSSNSSLATVGSGTGVVTGVATGNPVITYSLATGCIATAGITVNPVPAAITGTTTLCDGASSTLSDPTSGGTWSSSDVTNATIGSSSGIVNTVSSGPATISYKLATGCAAKTLVNVNDLPSDIAGNTDVCFGTSDTLTDPDGGGTWSSSNTSVATIGSTTGIINGVALGTFTATYTFTSTGCSTDAGVNIDVVPSAITGNLGVCIGSTTDLDDSISGGDWTSSAPGKGSIDIATGIVSGLAAGTTTISYTLPTGCATSSVAAVSAMPTLASATSSSPICSGSTLNLTANTPTNVTGYSWSGPVSITSSTSASASVPAATTAAAGSYSVTVNNGAGAGCVNTYTTSVIVKALPTISGGSSVAVCSGSSTALTASGAVTYSWSPATALSVTTGASVTANPASTITYTVTGTNSFGCANTAAVTVSVNPLPTISGGSSVAICTGSSTVLTASGGVTYSWSPATSLSATTGASVTANPTSTTTYTVTGTNSNGCVNTGTVTVTVNPLPTISGGSGVAVCSGSSTVLAASGGVSYSWAPATALSATTGASVTANPTSAITYTVTGTNSNGCVSKGAVTVSVNPLPTISGGSGATVCSGSSTVLTASGGVSYSWSPATALSATTGASVTANPTSTITYTVTGANSNGCVSTGAVTVSVNPLPAISGGSSVAICTGSSTVLTASGGVTYSWSPATALSATTGASVTANPTSTITYTVTGTNSNGCVSTGAVTVTVNPLPTISGGSSVAICSSSSTVLTANGGTTYAWSPATALSATTGASVTANPASTITYTVTGTNSNGCVNKGTVTVTVNSLPTISGGSGATICNGLSTVLTASGGVSYSWLPAIALSATTGTSVTANPASTTTYTVTGTNSNGCANTGSVTVSVNPLPTISGGSGVAICNGLSTGLTASGGINYSWSPATALSATTGASVTANPASTTTYTVTGTNSNGCANTSSVTVSVNPLPTISGGSSVGICTGSSTVLAASGGTTYSWSPATALSATTGASVTANPTSTINYTVTGTNSNGCVNTGTVTVSVNSLPSIISIGNNGPICAGVSLNLTSAASGGSGTFNYSWVGPNTFSSTVQNPTITAATIAAAGTYTLTTTDANGCSGMGTNTTTVSIIASPVISSTGNGGAICAGNTLTLTTAASGGTGGLNYSWSGPNSFTSTIINPSISAATTLASGTYTVTITDANSCVATGSNTTTASVNPIPSAGNITGASSVCMGNSTTLGNSVTGGVWSTSSSIATIGSTSGVVTGVAISSNTISYTVTNSYSCSNVATLQFSVVAAPGYIYAFGGTGVNSTTGDGGQAYLATMRGPRDIAVDTAGNLYFCDVTAGLIRKISTTGIITTIAGNGSSGNDGDNGPATAASFSGPNGIYVDIAGNVFISNTNMHTIRKVNAATGTITTICGIAGSPGSSGDGGPASAAKLYCPLGLCGDTLGNLYIADQSNYRVRKIDGSTGIITTIMGTGSNFYSGDSGLATAARMSIARSVVLDNKGNLYATDNSTVRKIVLATGIVTRLAGNGSIGFSSDGGQASASSLDAVGRLAYDGSNTLYISEIGGNRIRQVDLTTGIITTMAGNGGSSFSGNGGPAIMADISGPYGIACDKKGKIYIVDGNNRRIRVASIGGSINITLAGPTSVPLGTAITFTANATITSSEASLQWQKNGVNVGTGATTYTDSAPANGDKYNCLLTITPECGSPFSDASDTISIMVYAPPPVTPAEVNSQANVRELVLYPNPAHESFIIKASGMDDGAAEINVYDQIGKAVTDKTAIITNGKLSEMMDIRSLANGVYIVNVTDATGNILRLKFVKD